MELFAPPATQLLLASIFGRNPFTFEDERGIIARRCESRMWCDGRKRF
jgi:hypothetical protein